MNEKRKGEIAYQLLQFNIRKDFNLRDIDNAKRNIGNLAKQPEIVKANISKEELLCFGKIIIREILESQMKKMDSL